MIDYQKPINITINGKVSKSEKGKNLLSFLRENNYDITADCAGNGTCEKCTVIIDGASVLACRYNITEDITVELKTTERYKIASDFCGSPGDLMCSREGYGIAIDIGTTTVVIAVICLFTGKQVSERGFLNPQRSYGSDVMSRISSAENGHLKCLKNLICNTIEREVEELLDKSKIRFEDVTSAVISGNTVMIYLLLGCEPGAPFKPDRNILTSYLFNNIFPGSVINCPVFIIPWISAFIGGDITSGLLSLNVSAGSKRGSSFLFVDLGTNGEISLYSEGKFYCASAAAGPAFEGGNISCGIGGISGAIYSAKYKNGKFEILTIDGIPPVGICGSGILEITSELLKNNIIDENGLICDEYFESGIPVFSDIILTQKDIREIQMAKSAIRTGIEILFGEAEKASNSDCFDIQNVFLGGGFGKELSIKGAVSIGLFPENLKGTIMALGNSSLAGACEILRNPAKTVIIDQIIDNAIEINLAEHSNFNEYFVKYMNFVT